MTSRLSILLVEDEPILRSVIGDALEDEGHWVERHARGDAGAEALRRGGFDLLVSDVRLPALDGYELATRALEQQPPVAVLLMTAYGEVDRAVAMLKRGVRDYLTKPFEEEELLVRVRELVAERPRPLDRRPEPVAGAPLMVEALRLARQVAPTSASLLILGETGTGKEVVAKFVHDCSPRRGGPFVAANCGALSPQLAESMLFGHVRGAFTGATHDRSGLLRAAEGGTLLLDEVAELPPPVQAALLRCLETREVRPVGSDRTFGTDLRRIAATNKALHQAASAGEFRMDLLFRLDAFEIELPPLRERPEDIRPLAARFLASLRARTPQVPRQVTEEAAEVLARYPWPGNVRELRNAIEHASVVAGRAPIRPEHLPRRIHPAAAEPLDLRAAVERVQADQIRRALAIAGGRKGRAAELLGISRKHLWELMKRHP